MIVVALAIDSSSQTLFAGNSNGIWKYPPSRTLGESAASLARTVVGADYGFGAKGWDREQEIASIQQITISGYEYWNPNLQPAGFESGTALDCSGLVVWAYAAAANTMGSLKQFLDGNPIGYQGADGLYRSNTVAVNENDLQPGDLLFVDTAGVAGVDHVAMFVGNNGDGYNVVEATPPRVKLTTVSDFRSYYGENFKGFGRIVPAEIGIRFKTKSPISLVITDPDGLTITPSTLLITDREYLTEIPGALYYSHSGADENGFVDDVVTAPVLKPGSYLIQIVPKPGTAPSDTYGLEVEVGDEIITLAEDIPISNIPSEGYMLSSDGNTVVQVLNSPPVANDDSVTTDEDVATTIDVAANDTDADGNLDPSTASVMTDVSSGTLTNNLDGTFLYTPNANYYGSDGFTYQVCDTEGECDTASVGITVNPVNDPPVLTVNQGAITVDEGQPASNSGTVGDVDGDAVLLTASAGIAVNYGDGTWSWSFTTSDGPIESQTVTIAADDGNGGVGDASFDLDVNNVAPSVNAGDDATITSGDTFPTNASFTDPGIYDTHTATIDFGVGAGPQSASVSESSGSGSVSGSQQYFIPGTYVIQVCVTDKDRVTACDGLSLQVQLFQVTIDIKPGSYPNSINLGSGGSVPVAILSTSTFDATTIDPLTISLANAGVRLRGKGAPQAVKEDVNGDGLLDLVVHITTEALQLTSVDTQAILSGQTYDGVYVLGADSVRIVPEGADDDAEPLQSSGAIQPTSTVVDTATPNPTATLIVAPTNAPPTALPFPTVDLSTAVAPVIAPATSPLSLPALATLDDGAPDWLASSNWFLQAHESGLAWVMIGTSSETLRWQTPIDLRNATAPVALTFQSWLVGEGLATVQVSTDGLTWQQVADVAVSDTWTDVSVDLSVYTGTIIQIAFVWQESNPQAVGQWGVDTVLVAEVVATLTPTEQSPASTETALDPTQGENVATETPAPSVQPTVVSTETAPPTETPTVMSTDTPLPSEASTDEA